MSLMLLILGLLIGASAGYLTCALMTVSKKGEKNE